MSRPFLLTSVLLVPAGRTVRCRPALKHCSAFCLTSACLLGHPVHELTCRLGLKTSGVTFCGPRGCPCAAHAVSQVLGGFVPNLFPQTSHAVSGQRDATTPLRLPGVWLPVSVVTGWPCRWGDTQTDLRHARLTLKKPRFLRD